MRSPQWDEIRQVMLARAGYRCQVCERESSRLYVRHLTYDRVKDEQPEDLVVVCGRCNYAWHQREQGAPWPEGLESPQAVTPPEIPHAATVAAWETTVAAWEAAVAASPRPDLERLIGQALQDAGEDLA